MDKRKVDESAQELRFRGRGLVLRSDRQALKRLYSRLTATACMENGPEAAVEMRREIADLMLAPSRSVRWDTFEDL